MDVAMIWATSGNDGGAPSHRLDAPSLLLDRQIGWTLSAWGPLAPWLAVYSTRWLSWRLR